MNASMTVADIVRQLPSAAAVFHRNGIDYCCGGKRSLTEACERSGSNVQAVLSALNTLSAADGTSVLHMELWEPSFLVDYITRNHHRYVRATAPIILEQLERVARKHGERFPDIFAIRELFEDLVQTLHGHLADEEEHLFPQLRQWFSATPNDAAQRSTLLTTMRSEISKHEMEHSDVGKKLERMRAITNNYTAPAGACQTHQSVYHLMREFSEDLMQHVFIENTVLFSTLDQPRSIL